MEAAKMRKQRNTAQRKKHIKPPEKELNKMEINILSIRGRVQNTVFKDAQEP